MTVSRVKLADDLEFSRIVYGMWRLSDDADTSPAHVRTKIEACLEQGITTMDQADIYGDYAAEEVLGRALAGTDLRESIEIVTKCDIVAPVGRHADAKVKHYDTSAAHIEASVDHSLRLMGIERIDLLLIHRPDPLMDHHETGAALDGLIAAGKVGHVGVSNFRPWDWSLLQSAMNATLATNQIELSLLAHAGFSNGDVAFLQERGVPPMAWSPLAGGSLFAESSARMRTALDEVGQAHGVDASAVAIAWLLRHPANILPVMGTNNLDRIRTLADAEKVDLDRQTWFHLYELALGHEVP